ncbi:NAD(P)/FAD-dependent oxidoreductase [Lacinutrix chionoecetis]
MEEGIETIDYIIVGCGLAGIAFSEQLIAHNKSFIIFDNSSQQSSVVAGGLYNPVILKRFTTVWKSEEQLELAIPFFEKIEQRLNIKLDYKIPVYRRFSSLEEQNNWFVKSDETRLSNYMLPKIHKNINNNVNAAYGFGEVLQTGRIDTKLLIEQYKRYLKKSNQLIETGFDYKSLNTKTGFVYNNFKSKNIVFAEGFGLKNNPYFNFLPLVGTKGELLTIYAPALKIEVVIKSSVFIIPLGNDYYRIGSTYNHEQQDNSITSQARDELVSRLKTIINCDFKVVNQVAGIRPTVTDRRPLVGSHSDIQNMYVLNGLGTRGVMIGPYAAKKLYNLIENNQDLDQEIDIARFAR